MVISSAIEDERRIRGQFVNASPRTPTNISQGFRSTLQAEITQQRLERLETRSIQNFLDMKKDGMRDRQHHYWHLGL